MFEKNNEVRIGNIYIYNCIYAYIPQCLHTVVGLIPSKLGLTSQNYYVSRDYLSIIYIYIPYILVVVIPACPISVLMCHSHQLLIGKNSCAAFLGLSASSCVPKSRPCHHETMTSRSKRRRRRRPLPRFETENVDFTKKYIWLMVVNDD